RPGPEPLPLVNHVGGLGVRRRVEQVLVLGDPERLPAFGTHRPQHVDLEQAVRIVRRLRAVRPRVPPRLAAGDSRQDHRLVVVEPRLPEVPVNVRYGESRHQVMLLKASAMPTRRSWNLEDWNPRPVISTFWLTVFVLPDRMPARCATVSTSPSI